MQHMFKIEFFASAFKDIKVIICWEKISFTINITTIKYNLISQLTWKVLNFVYIKWNKIYISFIIESYKQHNKRNLWKKKLPKKIFMKLNWQNYSTINIIISSFYMTKKKIYIGTKNTLKKRFLNLLNIKLKRVCMLKMYAT